jgi:hypothetical protein
MNASGARTGRASQIAPINFIGQRQAMNYFARRRRTGRAQSRARSRSYAGYCATTHISSLGESLPAAGHHRLTFVSDYITTGRPSLRPSGGH